MLTVASIFSMERSTLIRVLKSEFTLLKLLPCTSQGQRVRPTALAATPGTFQERYKTQRLFNQRLHSSGSLSENTSCKTCTAITEYGDALNETMRDHLVRSVNDERIQ